jgi:pSer/pThr/pTyr-binding forkhead associated (FHA) protein
MLRVKVYKDGTAVHKVDCRGDDLIIGRESNADIQLHSQAVSRRHARLQRTGDGWQVADLGAANGVYVAHDGGEPERVVIQPLGPGDVIIIETFSIKIQEVEDTGEMPTIGAETFDENSLATKRTQFISMVEVLEAGEGALKAPVSGEGAATIDYDGPVEADPAAVSGDAWQVRLASAEGHDRTFSIAGRTATVGTADECVIRLPSGPATLAELDRMGPTVSLKRVSKWPFPRITVDGQAVKDAALNDGDSFKVGDFELTIQLPSGG